MGIIFRQTDFQMDQYYNAPCVVDFVNFLLEHDELRQRHYVRFTADALRSVTLDQFCGWSYQFFVKQGDPSNEQDRRFAQLVQAIYGFAGSSQPVDADEQVLLLGKLRGAVLERFAYLLLDTKSRPADVRNRGCRIVWVDDSGAEDPWISDKRTVDVAWQRPAARKIALFECKAGKGSLDHDLTVMPLFELFNRKLAEVPVSWHTRILGILSFHDHAHLKGSLEDTPWISAYGYQRLTEITNCV